MAGIGNHYCKAEPSPSCGTLTGCSSLIAVQECCKARNNTFASSQNTAVMAGTSRSPHMAARPWKLQLAERDLAAGPPVVPIAVFVGRLAGIPRGMHKLQKKADGRASCSMLRNSLTKRKLPSRIKAYFWPLAESCQQPSSSFGPFQCPGLESYCRTVPRYLVNCP